MMRKLKTQIQQLKAGSDEERENYSLETADVITKYLTLKHPKANHYLGIVPDIVRTVYDCKADVIDKSYTFKNICLELLTALTNPAFKDIVRVNPGECGGMLNGLIAFFEAMGEPMNVAELQKSFILQGYAVDKEEVCEAFSIRMHYEQEIEICNFLQQKDLIDQPLKNISNN